MNELTCGQASKVLVKSYHSTTVLSSIPGSGSVEKSYTLWKKQISDIKIRLTGASFLLSIESRMSDLPS